MKHGILLAPAALLLSACSFSADTKAAEEGVARFHNALNAGQFDQSYSATGTDFKAVTSHDDFTKLLAAIHTKLGNFRSGATVGWNDNATTGGHYVTLNRNAQFDRGKAQEQFVFAINGDRLVMSGYHIASNDLITG